MHVGWNSPKQNSDWSNWFICDLFFYFLLVFSGVVVWEHERKMDWQISPNSQKNTHIGVSFLKKFITKETPTQVFSCEFNEIFKNNFL